MQTIEISNIDDYCQKVEEIRKVKDKVYFRGEPSYYKHRVPSLFRPRVLDGCTLFLDNVSSQNYIKQDDDSEYVISNAEGKKKKKTGLSQNDVTGLRK